MSDEIKTTSRGFAIYAEFEDSHGRQIRVQESSAAGEPRVWIFAQEPDGTEVKHWRKGGGWEHAPKPGANDPPWEPGQPLRVMSEGWSSVSPHLSPDNCRELIAALRAHLAAVGEPEVSE